MLRARLVGLVLSAVAFFAVAVPLAHAGGASGQPLPDGTTGCRLIVNSANPSHVVNLADNFINQDVQVGTPVLLCEMPPPDSVPVTTTVVKGPTLTTVVSPIAMTCYQVSGSNNDKTPVTITDPFGTQAVQLAGFRLLCVPAAVQVP